MICTAIAVQACTPDKAARADRAMGSLMKELNAVGLSVAVIKDNQVIYASAFGLKNLETGVSLSPKDLMRIASISKSFTATAIMQLSEAGHFNLEDDISEALGFSVRNPLFPGKAITYSMLLSHTSSLNDDRGYFTLDVINPAKSDSTALAYNEYEPGTAYEYCNLGFNTLGTLIEIHSGERFDQYIANHIINPLGLNASFNVNALDPALLTTIYNFEDGRFVPAPEAYNPRTAEIESYVLGYSTPVFSPTGGMKINASDLARHALVQMNEGTYDGVIILSPESVRAMQTPRSPGGRPVNDTACGYGYALETTDRLIEGEVMTGHTGGAYGLVSAMYFNPAGKFGFIMMCNGYDSTIPRCDNGFTRIQSDVINALYDIFIR